MIKSYDKEKILGLSIDEVPNYLYKVVTNGTIISNKLKNIGNRQGYERIYDYEGNHYIITAIGTNGFIVSAYPINKRRKK